jgi:hypothetical protein
MSYCMWEYQDSKDDTHFTKNDTPSNTQTLINRDIPSNTKSLLSNRDIDFYLYETLL